MKVIEKGENGYKKGDRHKAGYYKEYYWKKKNASKKAKKERSSKNTFEYDKHWDDYYDSFGAGEDVAESEGW